MSLAGKAGSSTLPNGQASKPLRGEMKIAGRNAPGASGVDPGVSGWIRVQDVPERAPLFPPGYS
jgi:hypothetical protein